MTLSRIDPNALRSSLSEAESYREFLRLYFSQTRISYAEVARRSGFSSRSYPRDVTEGRRKLTSKSLPVMVRGLKLEPKLGELFRLLYFCENPAEFSAQSAQLLNRPIAEVRLYLQDKIELVRKRIKKGALRANFPSSTHLVFPKQIVQEVTDHLFEVLASLGSPEDGVTLEELYQRTALPKTVLLSILNVCMREKMVLLDAQTNRYHPCNLHLNLTGLPRDQIIRSVFSKTIARAGDLAKKHYDSGEALFYVSAISVEKKKLSKFKNELRELLLKFAETKAEQASDPDTVIYVVGSMFEARLT